MKNLMARGGVVFAAALTMVTLAAGAAFASPPDPIDAVGDSAETLRDDLITLGIRVLPYAAAVLVISVGWRFAKKFVRG